MTENCLSTSTTLLFGILIILATLLTGIVSSFVFEVRNRYHSL